MGCVLNGHSQHFFTSVSCWAMASKSGSCSSSFISSTILLMFSSILLSVFPRFSWTAAKEGNTNECTNYSSSLMWSVLGDNHFSVMVFHSFFSIPQTLWQSSGSLHWWLACGLTAWTGYHPHLGDQNKTPDEQKLNVHGLAASSTKFIGFNMYRNCKFNVLIILVQSHVNISVPFAVCSQTVR